jgi:hypothetical protein
MEALELVISEFIETENNVRHINVFHNTVEDYYSVTFKEYGSRFRVAFKMFKSSKEAFEYGKTVK